MTGFVRGAASITHRHSELVEESLSESGCRPSRPTIWPFLWIVLLVALAGWTAHRIGAFDLWTTVVLPDGTSTRLPDTFAQVDHPFHATRADMLRRALTDGDLLRWIGLYHGGYPAEFYPLGVAAVDVLVWAALFGLLPVVLVHKLVVVAIFLLPGLAFALIAARDRLPLGVAFVALAAHVSVRGWWWSGGYRELIEWGLVTNVAAAVAALFTLVFLTSFLARGGKRDAAFAASFAAFGLYANPRSVIALAAVWLGAAVSAWLTGPRRPPLIPVGARAAAVAAVAALLAAPEIVALVRFQHLYFFIRYERYADLAAYGDSSIQAVSGPVFVFACLGLVSALLIRDRPHLRAAAIALAVYSVITAGLSVGPLAGSTADQLETTRLMPFQRLLTMLVAAAAVHDLVAGSLRRFPRYRRLAAETALLAVGLAVPVLYVVAPPGFIPAGDRGLVEVATAATPAVADLERAIETADREAAPGTALLVLGAAGSPMDWHTQLWANRWTDRPVYYDDWLWYWQNDHAGPYDPRREHAYQPARMAETLDDEFLQTHGIGAVILAETARTAAAVRAAPGAAALRAIREGVYRVYLVRDPATIVTFGDQNPSTVSVTSQSIEATGDSSGGDAVIRMNWFPRWRAEINGEPAPINNTSEGYMSVAMPPGEVTLVLTYGVDEWDWFARLLCAVGIVLVVAALLARSNGPQPSPRARPRKKSGRV